jgi:glycosyltransferase involved in cell wall biosynthesis
MKVLHVSPSFYPAHVYGGTISSGYGLCRSLSRTGCEVRILTTDTNGIGRSLDVNTREETIVGGLRVRYCRKFFRHSVSAALIRELPAYVQWADIVHLTAVYSFPTFPTLAAARIFNKPVVWSPRGALQRWDGSSKIALKRVWESMAYKIAGRRLLTLHLTSAEEAQQSLRRFPQLRAVVIPNGVDIASSSRRELHGGDLRLLYIGRLHPIKGVEALLHACSRVGKNSPSFRLRIAGAGTPSYLASLKTMVDDLGLHEQIEFVGDVRGEKKEALFDDSDLVVVPSHVENFAMVVAESLAHGLPVIASKGTPWHDLETHGCGLWVENQPESLAAAICRMREMPLAEMGERGRQWMREHYSWDRVSTQMVQLYQECIEAQMNQRDLARS